MNKKNLIQELMDYIDKRDDFDKPLEVFAKSKNMYCGPTLTAIQTLLGIEIFDMSAPRSDKELGEFIDLIREIPEVKNYFKEISQIHTYWRNTIDNLDWLVEIYDNDLKNDETFAKTNLLLRGVLHTVPSDTYIHEIQQEPINYVAPSAVI